tara:strand:+ start:152 stop:256 length:105 start_codon:yes stop_codon:yes gene_type:complete
MVNWDWLVFLRQNFKKVPVSMNLGRVWFIDTFAA